MLFMRSGIKHTEVQMIAHHAGITCLVNNAADFVPNDHTYGLGQDHKPVELKPTTCTYDEYIPQ
jgi:hypothetical protein